MDGELEGDFGELDGEEEDALLADDDYMYQVCFSIIRNKFYSIYLHNIGLASYKNIALGLTYQL